MDGHQPADIVSITTCRRRSLRVAVVTETYPPEVNGVAAPSRAWSRACATPTMSCSWCARASTRRAGAVDEGFAEVLMRGLPIPRYPQLKMGLPPSARCCGAGASSGPDVVHSPPKGRWAGRRCRRRCSCAAVSATSAPTSTPTASTTASAGCATRSCLPAQVSQPHALHDGAHRGAARDCMGSGFRRLRRGVARRRHAAVRPGAAQRGAARSSWGVSPQDTVVMCVGRLAAEKNLEPVLRRPSSACAPSPPRARLVLVGDGPTAAPLQQRCPQAVFAGMRAVWIWRRTTRRPICSCSPA
jgi:hypothetical protein